MSLSPRALILTGLLAGAVVPAASAATLTVALDGSGDFTGIAEAMAAAASGDLVLVKPGEYEIPAPMAFEGKAITVRGEEGSAKTVIRLASGALEADRASVAIFDNDEGPDTVLEGFTLAGGRGTRNCSVCLRRGGGIYCPGSSPTLRDLRVSGNSADLGGGIYLAGDAAPVLEDSTVEENEADRGGGVCIAGGSRAKLSRCVFARNAAKSGGGIQVSASDPLLEGCRVLSNSAGPSGEGGGISLEEVGHPIVRSCEIRGNVAGTGGGISCLRSSASFDGCTILGNAATVAGGGARLLECDPTFNRCRISANSAGEGEGGGLRFERSSPVLTGCVLAANSARRGGGFFFWIGEPVLDHCTIARNAADEATFDGNKDEATVFHLKSCIVWGNAAATSRVLGTAEDSCLHHPPFHLIRPINSLDADPRFCGWPAEDLHVDPAAGATGPGGQESSFTDLAGALASYSLALRDGSPCRGKGKGGTDMGADLDSCSTGGTEQTTLRLASGEYDLRGLAIGVPAIQGSGAGLTLLRGTVTFTGRTIASLTVTRGENGGIALPPDARMDLRDVVIRDNRGPGIRGDLYTSTSVTMARCTIAGNRSRPDLDVDPGLTGAGIYGADSLSIEDSIVWGNAGGSIVNSGNVVVRTSCIDGGWAGAGNIAADPIFCGWRRSPEIHVGPPGGQPADGSAERPFGDLEEALDPAAFLLSLVPGSP